MALRKLLTDALKACVGDEKRVAVAFGGIDSLSIVLCLLDLGVQPVLYTYVVEGTDSDDVKCAEVVSDIYGPPLHIVEIPADVDTLARDVQLLVDSGIRGKVNIQCCHGQMYVARAVRESVICNGSGADTLYGSERAFVLAGAKDSKGRFDRMRRGLLEKPNNAVSRDQRLLYAAFGHFICLPYQDLTVVEHFMQYSWKDLNEPEWKAHAFLHFPEMDGIGELLPKGLCRGSQQIVAGTRALHDKLLRSPLNQRSSRSVIGIYNDLARQTQKA